MLTAAPQAYRQPQECPSQPVQVPVLTRTPPRPMQIPVGTRVSNRANKGQTSKYDDFVQHINLAPGTYACDGANLYKLEDTNTINHQVWTPDTAYVQALTHDRYQRPWVPKPVEQGRSHQAVPAAGEHDQPVLQQRLPQQ